METAALCKPIQRSADLLRIPGTWVLTGLGKLLAVLGSFPQFRTASTTASHTSFWRFLECQSIEATLTQNGHLTHHEIPSVASLRPGGHFPRIGWPVSPEYALRPSVKGEGLIGWFSPPPMGDLDPDLHLLTAINWKSSNEGRNSDDRGHTHHQPATGRHRVRSDTGESRGRCAPGREFRSCHRGETSIVLMFTRKG